MYNESHTHEAPQFIKHNSSIVHVCDELRVRTLNES